jgi:polysaccharide deacetylase family protein (PEP-CTERM system associated)
MLHQFVYTQTQKEFRDDLRKSLNLLESITYTPVRSYRAPYFSITPESFWALDILREEGILYDSSIFPIRNLRYGIPNARRTPHEVQPGLWEWPVSTLPTALGNIPFAGGVYFRFLPWKFVDGAIRMLEKRNEPVVFYLHPWEMDPDQPRYRTSSRFLNFRHYYNLDKTFKKFERVLRTASYTTITCGANMLKLEMPG